MYEDHSPAVWRYVRARIPDPGEAQDVTSEVFARAWRSWDRYDASRGSVGAWLMGVAHHAVADWWRTRRPAVADAGDRPAPDDGPEELAVRRADVEAVRRSLRCLNEREQEALALRFAGGLKATEVAEVLGLTEGATKMLVHRAIGKLRGVMSDEP